MMGNPIFDFEAARRAIVASLPAERCWMVDDQPLRHRFHRARERLVPVADEIDGRWLQPAWAHLVIFGESDYAGGGGASPLLTIDGRDGAVVGLDIERDGAPLFLFNSSIERFIDTFRYLDSFLGSGATLPHDAPQVVQTIDAAFGISEWRLLVEHIRGL